MRIRKSGPSDRRLHQTSARFFKPSKSSSFVSHGQKLNWDVANFKLGRHVQVQMVPAQGKPSCRHGNWSRPGVATQSCHFEDGSPAAEAVARDTGHETRFATRQHTPETDRGPTLLSVDQTKGLDHVDHTQRSLSNLFPILPGAVPQLGLRILGTVLCSRLSSRSPQRLVSAFF